MIKKIYKFLFYSALVILAANASYSYASYKMHQELPLYSQLSTKANELTQTYALCSGLLLSNPSEANIKSCNKVKEQLQTVFKQIDSQCPYISFYTKYVQPLLT